MSLADAIEADACVGRVFPRICFGNRRAGVYLLLDDSLKKKAATLRMSAWMPIHKWSCERNSVFCQQLVWGPRGARRWDIIATFIQGKFFSSFMIAKGKVFIYLFTASLLMIAKTIM